MITRSISAVELGKRGERRALWFYLLRGYRILARNARLVSGEIDLVVRRGRTLVVVEVKTRQSLSAGEGHAAVDRQKRERLVRLAEQYLVRCGITGLQLRYDILSLFWNGRRFLVSHYPDAFRPQSDPRRPWHWSVQ